MYNTIMNDTEFHTRVHIYTLVHLIFFHPGFNFGETRRVNKTNAKRIQTVRKFKWKFRPDAASIRKTAPEIRKFNSRRRRRRIIPEGLPKGPQSRGLSRSPFVFKYDLERGLN